MYNVNKNIEIVNAITTGNWCTEGTMFMATAGSTISEIRFNEDYNGKRILRT
jgi:hypothetical protein